MPVEETKTPPPHTRTEAKEKGLVMPEKAEEVVVVAPVVETPAKPEEKIPSETPKVNYDDITDEQLEEIASKRAGRKVSLKEPEKAPVELTEKEKEDLAEKEKTESIEWAFGTGKIKKDLYDKAIVEKSKNKRDIALSLFTAEAQAEDKALTVEDCEQMFADYYAEEEPETSWKRKKALKEMNAVADNHLAQYNVIDAIPEEYRAHKTTEQNQKAYTSQIKTIAKEIPADLTYEFPYKSVNGTELKWEFKIPVDEKVLTQITKEFTAENVIPGMIQLKPEAIAREMNFLVRARMMDKIIPVLLEQHAEKAVEDAMVNLKNARNPYQQLGGQVAPTAAPKTPPAHTRTEAKSKN